MKRLCRCILKRFHTSSQYNLPKTYFESSTSVGLAREFFSVVKAMRRTYVLIPTIRRLEEERVVSRRFRRFWNSNRFFETTGFSSPVETVDFHLDQPFITLFADATPPPQKKKKKRVINKDSFAS